ncbi:MAG TPA: LD-carboxypeptidase [Anaerolineales bacterium]|nr:LD-carboxypeptidase [Anaerolineales bacterium]
MAEGFFAPRRLRPGAVFGVAAPSTPVGPQQHAQLRQGIAVIQELGFEVRPAPGLAGAALGYAASGAEKAADLNALFADPAIDAVICAQGGMTANACLPFLDWALIRTHPKPFIGISDITVLLNAITTRTGLITFHGDDLLWGLGRTTTAYNRGEFVAAYAQGRLGPIPANRPRASLRGGVAEGRLWGGNLTALLKLAGTPYWPDLRGALLFLEEIDLAPDRCDCMLTQLEQMGVFDQITGVVIGYVDGQDGILTPEHTLGGILLRLTVGRRFPILKTEDFGHNCPNTVLPIGARARLDADALELSLLEPYVV